MPNFNLDTFMGKYKDFARTYLFYCRILGAPGVTGLNGDDHPFLVSAAKLPSQEIEEATADWQGMQYKIAKNSVYKDYVISFRCDVDSNIRKSFLKWTNLIHSPETNIHGNPGDSGGYFGTIALDHLNGKGEIIQTYNLVGAWPKSIAETSLDYSTKELVKFDVTFSYQYHIMDSVSTKAPTPTGMVG